MAAEKQRRAFISYSRTNKEFATKFTKELRSAGYPVWFDQLDIPTGARWDDEVEKALRECFIFLIILTPASIASENVKDEIGYAIDHGKRILPILLEDCDVPLRLRRFQYVDFTKKNFQHGLEDAKELLRDLVDEASLPVTAKDSPEAKPKPAKVKPASNAEKKPVPMGLIIGIVAVVVLVIAVIGFGAFRKPAVAAPTQAPVVSNAATEAPAGQVNGSNVYKVEYQGADYVGEFVLTGDKTWVERNKTSNAENSFSEINRDDWSVYLFDSTRNLNIKIDLYQKQIFVDTNDGNGETLLYTILSAESQ